MGLFGPAFRLDVALRAHFYHGLAEPSRLAILDALRTGERSAGEVAVASGLTLSNASHHLDCLEECGLLESHREWRHVYFNLAPGVAELLDANDAFISTVAPNVAACSRPEMRRSGR
jgi:DNA-binding transcriptional ArsR family regulator